MMQPYRLALSSTSSPTCLSPPIRACPPPRPRRRRIEILLAAGTFALAATTGAYAASAVGHGGHIEIGPAALHHARAHRAPRKTTPPPPPETKAPAPSRPLLGGVHEPKQLLARAKTLASLGIDLTVIETSLSHAFATWPTDANEIWPSMLWPLYGAGHTVEAFELRGIPATSPLREAGFAEGDVLLGIDGYDFDDPSLHRIDARQISARSWVIAEVARGAHHVILSIRWPAR